MEREIWNKCDHCGKFIGFEDFDSGKARRVLICPDSSFTAENYENLCKKCVGKEKQLVAC
jgi:hypothetical protein